MLILMVEKHFFTGLIATVFSVSVLAQISNEEVVLLKKLDSIRNSNSIARHFASLYFNTTVKSVHYFLYQDEEQKRLIERFESGFADLFFKAAEAYHNHDTVPKEWKVYFADSTLSSLQYQLIGINAHINGDIWQALTDKFNPGELKKMKKSYAGFQRSLIRQFMEFYQESYSSSARVRILHFAAGGFDKIYGKMLLKKWRKRQYQLAFLFYSDKRRFAVQLERLNKKMNHINHLVIHNL